MKTYIKFTLLLLTILCCFNLFNLNYYYAQSKGTSLANAAIIGNVDSGIVNKSMLLNAGEISLKSDFKDYYQISSFRLTRVRKGENPIELSNISDGKLTLQMLDLIKSTIPGDKVYFEYIKCKAKDNTTMSLVAISFIIE